MHAVSGDYFTRELSESDSEDEFSFKNDHHLQQLQSKKPSLKKRKKKTAQELKTSSEKTEQIDSLRTHIPTTFTLEGELSESDAEDGCIFHTIPLMQDLPSKKTSSTKRKDKATQESKKSSEKAKKVDSLRKHIPEYFDVAEEEPPIVTVYPVGSLQVDQNHFNPKVSALLFKRYHRVLSFQRHSRGCPIRIYKHFIQLGEKIDSQLKFEETLKVKRYEEISALKNLNLFTNMLLKKNREELRGLDDDHEHFLQDKTKKTTSEERLKLIQRYIKKFEYSTKEKYEKEHSAPKARETSSSSFSTSSYSFSLPSSLTSYSSSFSSLTSSVSNIASSYYPSSIARYTASAPSLGSHLTSLTTSVSSISRTVSDYVTVASEGYSPRSPLTISIHKAIDKILSTYIGRQIFLRACPKEPYKHDIMKGPFPSGIIRPIMQLNIVLSSLIPSAERSKFNTPHKTWYAESRTIIIEDPTYGYGIDYLIGTRGESIDDQILRSCAISIALASLNDDLEYLKRAAQGGHATGIIYVAYYFTIYFAAMKIAHELLSEGIKNLNWNHTLKGPLGQYTALSEHKARMKWNDDAPKYYAEILKEGNSIPTERLHSYYFNRSTFDAYFEDYNEID